MERRNAGQCSDAGKEGEGTAGSKNGGREGLGAPASHWSGAADGSVGSREPRFAS